MGQTGSTPSSKSKTAPQSRQRYVVVPAAGAYRPRGHRRVRGRPERDARHPPHRVLLPVRRCRARARAAWSQPRRGSPRSADGLRALRAGRGRCRSAGACSRPRAAGPRSPGAPRGRRLGLEERLGRSAKRAGPGLRKLGEQRPLLLLVVDVSAYRADVSHGPSNLWPRAGAPAIGRAVAYRYSLLSA